MARTRATGEGTIYRRKDGRWEVAIKVPTTTGVRKRKRLYATTRAEAESKLVDLRRQVRQGIAVPDKTWRVSEYFDRWLEEVVKPGKSYRTYSQCERTVRLYLKPGLGSFTLTQLSVPVIQRFVNQKLAEGYSVSNVQVMKKVLSAALTHAMREEHLVHNPARLVTLPTHEVNDYEPWTPEEARKFLEAAQRDQLYPAFLLFLINGLRLGEVLGLLWKDIDPAEGVLHVRRQLQRGEHGLELVKLKTKASKADLPLTDEIVDVLHYHKQQQLRDMQADGSRWMGAAGDDGLVFPAEHGKPMESSS